MPNFKLFTLRNFMVEQRDINRALPNAQNVNPVFRKRRNDKDPGFPKRAKSKISTNIGFLSFGCPKGRRMPPYVCVLPHTPFQPAWH